MSMHQLSKCSAEVKMQLYANLQAVIGAVDEHDPLIVVGDLSIRIGSSDRNRKKYIDGGW